MKTPVLPNNKITGRGVQLLDDLYPPPELQVNTNPAPLLSPSFSSSLCVPVFSFQREFHAEKSFCISAQSRQAPKQLCLIAAQLAWTLFIRRGMGIHQAELAQIRGRALFFFMCYGGSGGAQASPKMS